MSLDFIRLKLSFVKKTQKSRGCSLYQVLAFGRSTIRERGAVRVTWSISDFYTRLNLSGMAKDRIAKSCA